MADIRFSLFNRGQNPLGDDMHARFLEACEQARLADKLGYDTLMKGSHYSAYPLLDFQQVPFLARIMAEAPNMRMCAGIILLPLHKPLDVAETFANIDVMSGGKLVFGVGVGYREVEFQAFGTTMKDAGRRFEENLEAIKRLWTEEKVTMAGSHFTLEDASCPVKPLQAPMPPIWVGANADRAIKRAARVADAWFVNPHNRIDTIARQMDVYKQALEDNGKTDLPSDFPMMREVVVARTREEAMRQAEPYLKAKYDAYHEWGQDKVMPKGDDNLGLIYDELVKDRFLFGSPDEVSEQIIDIVKRFGINHFVFGVQFPGMPQAMVLDQMQMLAEDVFPAVRAGL